MAELHAVQGDTVTPFALGLLVDGHAQSLDAVSSASLTITALGVVIPLTVDAGLGLLIGELPGTVTATPGVYNLTLTVVADTGTYLFPDTPGSLEVIDYSDDMARYVRLHSDTEQAATGPISFSVEDSPISSHLSLASNGVVAFESQTASGTSTFVASGSSLTLVCSDFSAHQASIAVAFDGVAVNGILLISNVATADRPDPTDLAGAQLFDTDLGIPIWSNGTAWVNASGAPV